MFMIRHRNASLIKISISIEPLIGRLKMVLRVKGFYLRVNYVSMTYQKYELKMNLRATISICFVTEAKIDNLILTVIRIKFWICLTGSTFEVKW